MLFRAQLGMQLFRTGGRLLQGGQATAFGAARECAFQGQIAVLKCHGYDSQRAFRACPPVMMGRRSSKIATRKTAQDGRKAKAYCKIGKLIVQAVKAGGPDPVVNQRLKEVLSLARNSDVPRDIVDRGIKRASDKSQADYQEVIYEAYGPGGTGFVIECLTDNVNRTASEVRQAVTRGSGKMADPGSVLFNFKRAGIITVQPSHGEDEVLAAAMDAGADDVRPVPIEEGEPDGFRVLTSVEEFAAVDRALQQAGIAIDRDATSLGFVPVVQASLEDEELLAQNRALTERLLELDDVDAVFCTL